MEIMLQLKWARIGNKTNDVFSFQIFVQPKACLTHFLKDMVIIITMIKFIHLLNVEIFSSFQVFCTSSHRVFSCEIFPRAKNDSYKLTIFIQKLHNNLVCKTQLFSQPMKIWIIHLNLVRKWFFMQNLSMKLRI